MAWPSFALPAARRTSSRVRLGEPVWLPLLAAAGVLVATPLTIAWVFSESAMPPGADPGHMLALSYGLLGEGPEGPLLYPVGVPLAMAALRAIAGADTTLLLGLVKAFGILALVAQAAGIALLAGAVAGRRAAAWAFILAAAAPVYWLQVLWGGYPQFVAVGIDAAALALLWRGLHGPTRRPFLACAGAGVLFGVGVNVHSYTSVFFIAAGAALLVERLLRAPTRRTLGSASLVGALGALFAAPAIPTYLRILDQLRPGGPSGSYFEGGMAVGRTLYYRWEVGLVWALLFALPIAMATRSRLLSFRREGVLVGAFLVGGFGIFLITPPIHMGRLLEFATLSLAVLAACSLARLPWSRVGNALRRGVVGLVAASFLLGGTALAEAYPRYMGLGPDAAETMRAVAEEDPGRVLVVSPWPNEDGWWLEGLTGRPALIGDLLMWYVLQSEVDRAVAARTLVRGTTVLDGGALKLVDGSTVTPHAGPEVWVLDHQAYHPLFDVEPAGTWVGAKARPGGGEARVTFPQRQVTADELAPAIHAVSANGSVAVAQAVRPLGEGAEVSWRFTATDGTIARAGASLNASIGANFVSVARRDESLLITLQFPVEKITRVAVVQVAAPHGWSYRVEDDRRIELTFQGEGARALDASIHVHVGDAPASAWSLVRQEDLLEAWGVTHVYVRAEGDPSVLFFDAGMAERLDFETARFAMDPRYERVWTRGDVTLFRVVS